MGDTINVSLEDENVNVEVSGGSAGLTVEHAGSNVGVYQRLNFINALDVTDQTTKVDVDVASGSIQVNELDLSITPTWTGLHRFDSGLDTRGDLVDDTTTIYDSGGGHVEQTILENDSLTVAGNSVSLGSSTTVAYVDLSDTGASFPIPNSDLSNSSLTVAGNSISLGGSASIPLGDIDKVNLGTLSAGELLLYDNTGGHFENAPLTAGSGISKTEGDGSLSVSLTNDSISLTGGNAIDSIGSIALGGSDTIAVSSGGIQTDELDLSIAPTWTGLHDFSNGATIQDELSIPHFSTVSDLPSGLDNTNAVAMVDDLGQLYQTQNSGADWEPIGDIQVVGVEWNITQDTWRQIDLQGNTINMDVSDFEDIEPFSSITRVNMSPTGEINAYYGDSNYSEDGTNGRVMVQVPRCYRKVEVVEESGDVKIRKYISSHNLPGFDVFNAFNQRTGNPPADFVYVGAYQGDFVYDSSSSHYEIHSRAGKQPWTGGQIWEVDMDSLSNEPNIGDEVSTTSDSGWYVVDVDWSNGTMWVSKPGDDSLDWTDNESISNDTQGNTVADCEFSTGSKDSLHFDIEEARTYAENVGGDWGLVNIHTHWMLQSMFNIVYGNMDSQSELGKGIVDKAGGTGFNGELTATDSINSNLDNLLIGTGTGSDGYTPICFLGVENFWGNVWEFVDGYEAVDSEYRILDPSGNWTNAGPTSWTSSDYETSESTPLNDGSGDSDGYISDIHTEELLKYGYIGSATGGSSSEYIPDKFWIHDNGENNILRAGGSWLLGSDAGAGCLHSDIDVGYSARSFGARLEFIS